MEMPGRNGQQNQFRPTLVRHEVADYHLIPAVIPCIRDNFNQLILMMDRSLRGETGFPMQELLHRGIQITRGLNGRCLTIQLQIQKTDLKCFQ